MVYVRNLNRRSNKKYRKVRRFSKSRQMKIARIRSIISREREATHYAYGSVGVSMPFPPNLYTTVSFTQSGAITQTSAGTPVTYQYRANGLYDPVVAVGGGQPRYLDSFIGASDTSAPYNKYRVLGAKAILDILPRSSTTTTANALVSIIPAQYQVTAPSTLDEMRIRPYAKCALIGSSSAGNVPKRIVCYTNIKKHFGTKDLRDDPDFASVYNNSPSQEVYFNVSACAIDSSSTTVVDYVLTIKYYVQFFQLNDVLDS